MLIKNSNLEMVGNKMLPAIIGSSKSTISAWRNPNCVYYDPNFPKPIRYGNGRSVYFLRSELDSWLISQIAKRDNATTKQTRNTFYNQHDVPNYVF